MACPGRHNGYTVHHSDGRVAYHGRDATFEIGPPIPPGRRIEHGVVFTTMRDWYDNGPDIVRDVPGVRHLSIFDRSPWVIQIEEDTGLDRGHVELVRGRRPSSYWVDAYSWQHGFRWVWDPAEDQCAAYTIPQDVYRHLPPCPYEAIVRARASGLGPPPRWATPGLAMACMNVAAWNWAATDGRRT